MRTSLAWLAIPLGIGLGFACSSSDTSNRQVDGSGGSGTGGSGGGISVDAGSGGTGAIVGACASDCTDFDGGPLIVEGAPPNAAELFGDPSNAGGSGVCLVEPQSGTLIPKNWLRPRFRWEAAAGENLFEIRLSNERQKSEYVVYTTQSSWTMGADMWNNLAAHSAGTVVNVTIRGVNSSAPGTPTKTESTFEIAPVEAGGSMVYWATTGPAEGDATSKLVGFGVGEEGTVEALRVSWLQETSVVYYNTLLKPAAAEADAAEGEARCIGCHSSTPDGDAVIFNDGWPWEGLMASIEGETAGQRPSYLTQAGAKLIQQPWVGQFTFSKAVWGPGTRIAITSYGTPSPQVGFPNVVYNHVPTNRLAWFDLEAQGTMPEYGAEIQAAVEAQEGSGFGFLARNGDSRAAVNPDWSHDGQTIAYVSTEQAAGSHNGGVDVVGDKEVPRTTPTESDIYTVPYNNKAGGNATPVAGAAVAGKAEYYPDFSADDAFIAFTRVDTTIGYFYYRPDGEIFVVPSAGGTATRLAANDPPACTGQVSPGVINSWPKWSPSVAKSNGKSFYWLVFSSARKYPEQTELPQDKYSPPDTHSSQLYLAAVVVDDATGAVTTYPALYVWNQTTDTSNLTPAWDEFKIPPVTIR